MMDHTRYTVPAEARRWRAAVLAAALHAALLGALWLGARDDGDVQASLPGEPVPAAKEMAPVAAKELPKREAQQIQASKPAVTPQQPVKSKLAEQKKHVEKVRAAEPKRKEDQRRLEKQKQLVLAKQQARRDALAVKARKKEEKQKREALAKKNADQARKLAAEESLREKLRKEEMRRIAGGLAANGKG